MKTQRKKLLKFNNKVKIFPKWKMNFKKHKTKTKNNKMKLNKKNKS